MCTVSVIVPIYNTEAYLEACLDSLIGQTLQDIEIILVNDGSTDQSGEIAEAYSRKDSRIKLICQTNQGLGNARNAGLDLAKGKYIAFVDSDDWVIAKAYERLVSVAEQYKADMVMGNLLYCFENGKRMDRFRRKDKTVFENALSGRDCFVRLSEQSAFNPMVVTYLYRRDLIETNLLRFEPVFHEDALWTPVAMCLATCVKVIDFNFYAYRQRPGSIMYSDIGSQRYQALSYVADRLLDFTNKHSIENEDWELKSHLLCRIIWLHRFANR